MLLAPECATCRVTGCACGQHRYREQVHDCPEFPKNQSFVQPVSGLRWLVLLHGTLFTPPPPTTTPPPLCQWEEEWGGGVRKRGCVLIRASPQERIAEEFWCRGGLLLSGFFQPPLRPMCTYLEVCCLPSLDPFILGGVGGDLHKK